MIKADALSVDRSRDGFLSQLANPLGRGFVSRTSALLAMLAVVGAAASGVLSVRASGSKASQKGRGVKTAAAMSLGQDSGADPLQRSKNSASDLKASDAELDRAASAIDLAERSLSRSAMGEGMLPQGGVQYASLGGNIGTLLFGQYQGGGAQLSFEQLKDKGWNAIREHKWAEAEKCFVEASYLGTLGEGELRMVSATRRLMWRFSEALPVAKMNFEKYPCPLSLMEYSDAIADNGDYAQARTLLARLRGEQMTPAEQEEYRLRCLKIGIKEWKVVYNFTENGLVPRAKDALEKNGFYELPLLEDDDYQQCTYTVTGAAHFEEVRDGWGNRIVHLYPQGCEPVQVCIKVTQSPYVIDLQRVEDSTPIPESIRPYLGATPLCDPTTERAREIASTLKGGTYLETIANVTKYWDEHIRYPEESERNTFRTYFDRYGGNSEAVLNSGVGWCWEQTHAINALLRAAGVPARELLVFIDLDRTDKLGMHIISQVYLPGAGWVPYENNKPFGHFIYQYMALTSDTPEDINPSEAHPHLATDGSGLIEDLRVSVVYDRFLKVFWGTEANGLGMNNVSITLENLILD